jgi:hypothetical protein
MNSALVAHRIETTLTEDGTLTLSHLPFQAGEAVEIIVLPRTSAPDPDPADRYPLRGLSAPYDRPTEPVAADDWEALR